MKIAIRADGGSKIGMGHIMRTLVLAKELSKFHEVFYICRIDDPLSDRYSIGIKNIKEQGFTVNTIRENNVLLDLTRVNADFLITDSYDVNEEYFDKTKEMFDKTAYIDDINLYRFNVDFLINQNINSLYFKYKVNDNTKLLLGPQYIMLRDEFKNQSQKDIKEKPRDIMITVGGGDPYHVTEQILDYVKMLDYNFHVVVGPSFDKKNSLKSFACEKVKLYYNANIYEIMQKSDVAISACGSTLYELAASGVPTLGVIIASNQEGIAQMMDELEMIKNMGWYNKLSKNIFKETFTNLCEDFARRKKMSLNAKKVVDGKGAQRIAEELFQ